jgi:uncharacterized OsmC-like protein
MAVTMDRRNGIAVDQLVETVEAIGADPALGGFTFRATTTWQEGTHSTGTIHRFDHAGTPDTTRTEPFRLDGDEPPVLLGSNRGPNAVELLLQALGFCYAVGYVANAAARGIELTALDVDVEGDLDVRPFLGLDGPRAGFTAIRAAVRVSSPNTSRRDLEELWDYVQRTSPVRDCLAEPVPVSGTIECGNSR